MLPFNPHPDSNSSSFAYLDNLPPGTNPFVTPDPALPLPQPANPPRVQNTPKPEPVLSQGQDDLMEVDTGNDRVARSVPDASSDNATTPGPKRLRTESDNDEDLEYSEPETKRRRSSSADPATTESVAAPAQPVPVDLKKVSKDAAAAGNLDELKRLVGQDQTLQNKFVEWNLAHVAAKNGHTNILEWLAAQGADLERRNDKGHSALQVAARFGNLEVIQWLDKHGCDIEQTDERERTLVDLAAQAGHLDVIKWLHGKGSDIHQCNDLGMNAFHHAAKGGALEVMKWLKEQGSDIDDRTEWEVSALTFAVERGHKDVVEWLLQAGCTVHFQDYVNDEDEVGAQPLLESPVVSAVRNKDIDIIELFINHGINIRDVLDSEGNSLLFVAIKTNDPEVVSFLAPYFDMSARSASGLTPIMYAARSDNPSLCIPLILMTLKDPQASALLQEAIPQTDNILLKELLAQPALLTGDSVVHSKFNAGKLEISSCFLDKKIKSETQAVRDLQFQLGASQGMNAIQRRAAFCGVLAGLSAWKVAYHPDGSFYDYSSLPGYKKLSLEELTEKSFAELLETVNKFTGDDIDILSEIGFEWESKKIAPLFENLYEICLSQTLGKTPLKGIVTKLENNGIYHPVALGIAKAWQKAWMSVAAVAKPLLETGSPVKSDGLESEDRANQVSTTGSVALTPAIARQKIDSFLDTSVSTTLFDAFRTALRQEFDSVAGSYLRTDAPGLTNASKELYADLMNRQISMLAQFWRQ